ncbi:MAG: hypothetical protein JXQ75_06030 [Phycisphaerae bacterium]|nr:hypothetical protein [Phycisphaerae bacterium]
MMVKLAIGFCTVFLLMAWGCISAPEITDVRVTMQFENVRKDSHDKSADEWEVLKEAIKSVGVNDFDYRDPDPRPTDPEAVSKPLPGTNIEVRPVRATFVVKKLRDLEVIHGKILALRKQKQKSAIDQVDFELLACSAQLRYKSNYITAGIKITLSGVTAPNAEVTLDLPTGKVHFAVGRAGTWSRCIRIRPDCKWIYGHSVEPESGVKKYFRLNVFRQKQELLAKDEYEKLKATEK